MTTRRDFIKGALAGVGATVALGGGIKIASGDLSYLTMPLGGTKLGLLPTFHEEMKVIILGTGSPPYVPGRSKPANLVMASDKFFLVDCGVGAADRLDDAGVPPSRISDVFFTHHHSDHNSGFNDFLINSWNGRFGPPGTTEPPRNVPLQIYGPTNTRKIMGLFMDAMKWDIEIRAEHMDKSQDGTQVAYHEKNDGVVFDQDGIKVTAFTVDHGILKPAIGYRFEYKGKVIVISGDTRPVENMIRYSEKADILIHEAYSREWTNRAMQNDPNAGKVLTKVMNYHSSTIEAAEIAEKAKVKHLVYTHLIPAPSPTFYFEKNWAEGASDIYNGKITVGRDLMVF